MKFKKYILGLTTVVTLTGCSDFLNRIPLDHMSDESFFKSETDLEYYMNGLYDQNILRRQGMFRWVSLNNANDDVVGGAPAGVLMQHSSSGLASETDRVWSDTYDYLRKVNYFLQNASRVGELSPDGKHYLGEGYYCRAVAYFTLLQNFGGVPYVDKVLNVDSKELYNPREKREVIAQKIMEDIDLAIENLQWKGTGKAVANRINKETALVMKSRMALYEGSWEYYHGKKNSSFKVAGSDGSKFLQEAVKASEQLIEKCGNQLYKGPKGTEYFDYFNCKNYASVPGAFFYRGYDRSLTVTQGWFRSYSEGMLSMTKSAVDAYLMKDGKPADISSEKFDEKLMNSLAEHKDPRLGQTIWYPNMGRFCDYLPEFVNAYKTSYPGLTQNQQRNPCETGYRVWKGVCFDVEEYDNGEVDDLIIRYEEGLLNYAEAKAILGTLTQQDLDKSVNYIRARVQMPAMVLSEINGWGATYSKRNGYDPTAPNIINEIRRERRVELMLEGQRLDDLKRWAAMEDVFNEWKPVGAHAQEYIDYWNDEAKLAEDGFDTKTPAEVKLVKGINYDVIDGWINPLFKHADFKEGSGRGYYINPERDYLRSIPKSEILLYEERTGVILEQNPGYY